MSYPAGAACVAPAGPNHVFFVTDRAAAGDAQLFSGERGRTAHGVAVLQYGILGPTADRAALRRCASRAALLSALGSALSARRGRHVLIYIHGYYTPFRSAAADGLKLAEHLAFPGPLIVYSWPSKVTSRLTYLNDESNAGWSGVHFCALLAALLERYPNVPISFAAHSLGARFAADGIDFLRHSRCPACSARALLFAPDVDGDTLRATLAGAGLCRGKPPAKPAASAPVSLYVSNRDLALRQSKRLHGHQRAGQAGSEMLLCGGVDTIDVGYTRFSDKTGHSYHTNSRVVSDARAAVAGTSPAAPQRKLRRIERDGQTYYELR